MFSKNTLKGVLLSATLALLVLLLPIIPGTYSGPVNQAPDLALEPGLRLLSSITEKSESEFIASFSNDQQMIHDYAASAEKMATVALNPAAVIPGVLSPGDRIIVEVSEDKYYLVTVEEASYNLEGDIVRGQVEGSSFGFFHLTTTAGQTMAVLRVPEENKVYHIVYSNSGHYQLFEFAITEFERYKDQSLPPRIPPGTDSDLPAVKEHFGYETAGNTGPNDPATIDVMVVYTPAGRNWAGGAAQVNNIINLAMSRAQEALTNSNTGITMRLVHSVEVSYTEVNLNRSLDDITDGRVGNVHALRNTHGADLVAFFPYHNNRSGVAALGWYNGFGLPETEAFSAACITGVATSYLAIHEMGHNMGAHHHKLQNHQPGPHPRYSHAAGWRFEHSGTLYNTLMSYSHSSFFTDPSDPFRNRTSIEVGYFSTPLITYPGGSIPVGHAANGDNARMLRETKHSVASYRTATPTGPAVPTLVSPADGATIPGNSVTFSWNASSGANRYQMRIRPVGTSWNELAVITNTSETRTAFPNDGTRYEWAVRAGNSAGQWSNWSPARTFTSGSGSSGPAVPTLVSPANEANVVGSGSDNRITFSWNASSGADRYQMRIRPVGGNWQESSVTSNTSAIYTDFPNDGTRFEWAVRAGNSAGQWSNWSSSRTFTNSQTATTGSIRVRILPAGARTAGAKWRLTTGPDTRWKNHNATISNLPAGSYTIRFRNVTGWTRPANITVTVGTGLVTRTGTYQSSFIFNHNFNRSNGYHGWARVPQNRWSLNASALVTAGQPNRFVNAYNPKSYSNVDYQVRMRRINSLHSLNAIIIRAGNTIGSTGGQIYPAYRFGYTNAGTYNIYRHNANGTYTEIQSWTDSRAINRNGWNTLRVVANGNNFRFFINGTLVKTFNDSIFRSGRVGVAMWRSTSDPAATRLQVEWARLSQPSASALQDVVSFEQEALNQAAMEPKTGRSPNHFETFDDTEGLTLD